MYKQILVPIDGSEASEGGVAEAIRLARGAGATLHFLHVIDLTFMLRGSAESYRFAGQFTDEARQEATRLLDAAVRRAEQDGVRAEAHRGEITTGRAADGIMAQATEIGPDLIVIGTHGRRGLRRAMLGSDAESVARMATVPVLLVPMKQAG